MEDQTAEVMARDLGMKPEDVARVLDDLEDRGVVQNSTDATLETDVWVATKKAAEQLDPPSEH